MEKENKTKEIKIMVCGNDVEVVSDSIDYHGLSRFKNGNTWAYGVC